MTTSTTSRIDYFLLGIQASRNGLRQFDLLTPLEKNAQAPTPYLRRLAANQLQKALPEKGVHEGYLYCWAVLNAALHRLALHYFKQHHIAISETKVTVASDEIPLPLAKARAKLVELFPPAPLLRQEKGAQTYLKETASDCSDQIAELFLLKLQQSNPALAPVHTLFDDTPLQEQTDYHRLIERLDLKLNRATGGASPQSLWDLLKAPLEASPRSIEGQLHYLQTVWGHVLPPELLQEIDRSYAMVKEILTYRGIGKGPGSVADWGVGEAGDQARFTSDSAWMPKTVLIAKSTHVWLEQLSRRFQRSIERLDQIPDEVLAQLAQQGFTALWLIGAWQRATSSRKIKHLRGNTEAHASAYALDEYRIADDLGGEEALQNLQDRCAARGLRLACDVVPNHTGLNSRWMHERPDDFIQTDHPPYPSYRFTGPDLSDDADVSLRIEDGYYDNSDAAVVFEHRHHPSGRVRYIYHGNDGTHTPWNDTAQLDYLKSEVRERMIEQIVSVARNFSVIRFDAAMTLARKHFQRLWYPRPDGGLAIPSRHDFSLPPEEFDRLFPAEFWREVVDRIQQEVPETLLVAEAFWLMEGYFVRTLGMHRVYNSAFMNMLHEEQNDRYRNLLKETLHLNPGILQRFVNFLSNPDEETAVEQFGRGDKYFGAATLLATLPGLPLFGHGQIEGLQEKYGMEFRRAQRQEEADTTLIERHQRQIFPLLRHRALFSGAEAFELYDFLDQNGVNANVHAYSNRLEGQAALVVFNNSAQGTGGWIHTSCEKRLGDAADNAPTTQTTLIKALGLESGDRLYRFSDLVSGMQFLRSGRELAQDGHYCELGPYGHAVFWHYQPVDDRDGQWHRLWQRLNGHGCFDLETELHNQGPKLPPLPRRQLGAKTIKGPLKILSVSSEVAPFAKTGGLADVVAALPPALQKLGHQNLIMMPGYPGVLKNNPQLELSDLSLSVAIAGTDYETQIWTTEVDGVPLYVIEQDELFGREGIYATAYGDFSDNPLRFAFFSRAALELSRLLDFCPDIIHVHDWQTALIPALLQTDYGDDPFFRQSISVLTIHNLAYQGVMDPDWLKQLDLHPALAGVEGMEYYGDLSLLKAGIQCADRVNTVSKTYAKEVLTRQMGHGFDGLLQSRQLQFDGIVNGIDTSSWDPTTDEALAAPFSAQDLAGKKACKRALQQEIGLEVRDDVPIAAVVSRLDPQKGIDLLLSQWDALMERPIQLVILGTGDPQLMERLRAKQSASTGKAAILLTFDENLARRIYAGSDLFLMPSLYEPCGLSQLIALRYGAVPLVRQTGGLADTVRDAKQSDGTGFVFKAFTAEALLSAIDRALFLWQTPVKWKKLQCHGMKEDFSWKASAQAYETLYRDAMAQPLGSLIEET